MAVDRSLQVRAFLDKAREDANGKAWLKKLRDEALAATIAGDIEITTTSYEGGSDTGARKFIAQDLLECTQLALEELEGTGEPKSVVYDFSRRLVQT